MNTLQEKTIDIIITSPPYNLDIKYSSYKDNKDRLEYLEWIQKIFTQAKRVLKDNGSIFLNIGGSNIDPWIPIDVSLQLRNLFFLQNQIVWVKSVAINNLTFGHYKPINSERFLNHNFEYIFHFTKDCNVVLDRTSIGVPYTDKSNLKRRNHIIDKHCKGNCWFIPYNTIQTKDQKGNHPAIFPLEIPTNCIKLHGYNENTVVLDPFAGTGTTLFACRRLGVNGIGIEIDKNYYKFIVDKLRGTTLDPDNNTTKA